MRRLILVILVAAGMGCSHKSKTTTSSGGSNPVTEAKVTLTGAASQPKIKGEATFTQTNTGVHMMAQINGLKERSVHGIHIHEKGDCSAPDFSSAGGHLNPDGKAHGAPGGDSHHIGDLGNVKADKHGVAKIDMEIPGLSISQAPANLIGRSLVIHAKADDLRSQPAGDSGPRIACGVIQ